MKLRYAGLFFLASLILVASVPWQMSMPTAELDSSWQMALHYAYGQGMQFGRDIVFTFGSLGFLHLIQYHPDHYYAMLFFWASISSLFLFIIYSLSGSMNKLQLTVQIVLFYTVLTISVYIKDAFSFSYFALLLLFVLDEKAESGKWKIGLATFVLIFFSSCMGLMKYSGFILACSIFILLDTRQLALKKIPFYSVLFIALLILVAVTVGKQNLSSIFPYVENGWLVASGYSQGMQMSKSFAELAVYVSLLLAFSVFSAFIECREKRFDLTRITRWLGLLLVLFMSFKAGHVRQDGTHIEISWGTLVFVLALYSVYFFKYFPQRSYQLVFCVIAVLAIVPTIYIHTSRAHVSYLQILDQDVMQRFRAAGNVLFHGKHEMDIAYTAAVNKIKNRFPLQGVVRQDESVDIYPWQASILIANQFNYTPRPLLQSYQAYTGRLAAIDRDFLYSDRAPARLVFGIGSIDGRYSGMDDGYSWVDILSLYEMGEKIGSFVILKRRAKPGSINYDDLVSKPFRLGADILLPYVDGRDGYLMASIDLQKTILGAIINTFYKSPEIFMTLTRKDGSKLKYRLIPDVLSKGMIISPIVNHLPAWIQMLPAAAKQRMNADYIPVSVKFSGGRWFCYAYHCKATLDLKRLIVSNSTISQ